MNERNETKERMKEIVSENLRGNDGKQMKRAMGDVHSFVVEDRNRVWIETAPLAACLAGEALFSAGADTTEGAGTLVVVMLLVVVEVAVVSTMERKSKSAIVSAARTGSGDEPEEEETGTTTEPTPTDSIPYNRSPILVAAEGGGGRGGGG